MVKLALTEMKRKQIIPSQSHPEEGKRGKSDFSYRLLMLYN